MLYKINNLSAMVCKVFSILKWSIGHLKIGLSVPRGANCVAEGSSVSGKQPDRWTHSRQPHDALWAALGGS